MRCGPRRRAPPACRPHHDHGPDPYGRPASVEGGRRARGTVRVHAGRLSFPPHHEAAALVAARVSLGDRSSPEARSRCGATGLFVRSAETGPDERVLGAPAPPPRHDGVQDITDMPKFDLLEIRHFFEVYKDLEPGK